MQYKADAPTEDEFLDTQRLIGDPWRQQLLLEEQYKLEETISPQKRVIKEAKKGPIIEEPEDVPPHSIRESGETFINLWKDELVEDENSQVLCVD